MKNIEQIYTNCLAQGAYFIESAGEAVVIDPLRESTPYIQRAKQKGVKIKYIFETHFHADFVSGHLDLARKTGATIVYGPTAETAFEKYEAKDGEEFKVGRLTIRVLHTPGHTPESTTYLLLNEGGKEHAIFTGDTLFIGDVGRPDLAQKGANLTQEEMAGWLYDSLRNKIMPLSDEVIVYPAHGAGSACGKHMSRDTYDLLGNQKKTNYALRADMTKAEFIQEVTDGLAPPPQYFSENAKLNKLGYDSLESALASGRKALSLDEFKALRSDPEVLVLDVRSNWDFVKGHVPDSMFIGLDGSFAPWVGALIPDLSQQLLLVIDEGKEEEALIRLARVGYDGAVGYLQGGFNTWKSSDEQVATIDTRSVDDFLSEVSVGDRVIDVRKPGEKEVARISNAIDLSLDYFYDTDFDLHLEKEQDYFIHCMGGYRSTIASSILKMKGYHRLKNVIGGFEKIKQSHLNLAGVCPSLV